MATEKERLHTGLLTRCYVHAVGATTEYRSHEKSAHRYLQYFLTNDAELLIDLGDRYSDNANDATPLNELERQQWMQIGDRALEQRRRRR